MDEYTTIADLERRLAAAEAAVRAKADIGANLRQGEELQRAQEQRLRESEARDRLLIGSWAQAAWETGPYGLVVADSPSWRAYTGQTLEEWLGYGWLNAIHPDDRAYAKRQWREAVAAREPINAEFRLRSSTGDWRWTNVRAAPVFDAGGPIEKWVGINIDIDARKRAEAALRQSKEHLAALFSSAAVGLSELTPGGRFLRVNDELCRILGRSREEILRLNIVDVTFPEDVSPSLGAVDEALRSDTTVSLDKRYLRPDGSVVWANSRLCQLHHDTGQPSTLLAVTADLTERRAASERLRESEERQSFLLKLSDALRPLMDPLAIQEVASRILGEHLRASRVAYVEVTENEYIITRDYIDGIPSMVGRHSIISFGSGKLVEYEAGKARVVHDTGADAYNSSSDNSNFAAFHVRAGIGVPLIKDNKFVATLVVHMNAPRNWAPAEVALVEETAERTWAAVERARSEAATRKSEAKHRTLFERMGQGCVEIEVVRDAVGRAIDYRYLELNPAFERLFAIPVAEAKGRTGSEVFPGLEPIWHEAFDRIVLRGEPERLEYWEASLDRWFVAFAYPQGNDRLIILSEDVTEHKRAEAALRESEARFRQFAKASAAGLWIRQAATLAMEFVSPALGAMYGVEPEALLGDIELWASLIVPEDRDTARQHLEQARAGETVTYEFRIRRAEDGEVRWIKNTDFPLRDASGRVQRIGGIAEDVTEIIRSAKRQEVLVNELQHRARNLLGVVSAVAERTLKKGGSVEGFEHRLQALSRAQGLLSQAGSDTVEVGDLVRAELAAYTDAGSGRVTVSGPTVHLTARQVQNFALAVHELTTNAVKYGALKDGPGQLAVTWDVVLDRRDRRRLGLNWIESGVAVQQDVTSRSGYGTELIQEALAYALQAEVEYTLGDDGVHCRIEMPVS